MSTSSAQEVMLYDYIICGYALDIKTCIGMPKLNHLSAVVQQDAPLQVSDSSFFS